jgi:acetyl-CoA acetyltransferase
MTTPITVDDVSELRLGDTPYHKLDCSLISDGGAAFVVMRGRRASGLGKSKPIYILGAASATRTSTSS